jgi:hypothetical protein
VAQNSRPRNGRSSGTSTNGNGKNGNGAASHRGAKQSRKDKNKPVLMPSEVSSRVGLFDRFAGVAAHVAGRAAFFAFCVTLIVVWAPSILIFRKIDTWQLIINTVTTIITFLMVALLQNSQTRSDQAIQHKLNAIADGLADLMAHINDESKDNRLEKDLTELRDAVGLEEHESTSGNRG